VTLRRNLWTGGETKARVQEARFAESRAGALRKRADSAIQLEVRKAYLEVSAAAQRVEVASAAAAEAQEAPRIIQNRHQAGLTTVTELLRSETALSAARTRRLAAIYDHRVAAAALEYAAGTLAQVRHDRGRKSAKYFRISLGGGRVYTTFAIFFETIRKA